MQEPPLSSRFPPGRADCFQTGVKCCRIFINWTQRQPLKNTGNQYCKESWQVLPFTENYSFQPLTHRQTHRFVDLRFFNHICTRANTWICDTIPAHRCKPHYAFADWKFNRLFSTFASRGCVFTFVFTSTHTQLTQQPILVYCLWWTNPGLQPFQLPVSLSVGANDVCRRAQCGNSCWLVGSDFRQLCRD